MCSSLAIAQAPTRVRGTISEVRGEVLFVSIGGVNTAEVTVGEKSEIVFAQPLALSEIKSGDVLGVTSAKRRDGGGAGELRSRP